MSVPVLNEGCHTAINHGNGDKEQFSASQNFSQISTPSWTSPLPNNFDWLFHHCPVFAVRGEQVRILTNPNDFYKELLEQTSKATNRICISSLYLGTGKLEKDLVSCMQTRMNSCKQLRVQWLLDFTRGSRGKENSRTMLLPLLVAHSNNFNVSLYHTPTLRGYLKRIMPPRWNEIIGVQHCKIYLFDDTVIISGANLSNDYFTNRQDRYIVFEKCAKLADFYQRLLTVIASYSLQLTCSDKTEALATVGVHPYEGDKNQYCSSLRNALHQVWNEECAKNPKQMDELNCKVNLLDVPIGNIPDTLIFPTMQLGPVGLTVDSVVTQKILQTAEPLSRIQLASGYFNLTERYRQCILEGRGNIQLLMAHPEANGFLGAKGFAGAIPFAYTQLAKLFFARILAGGHENRLSLHEYKRENWTFHAKGLWYYPPMQERPSVTLIGSPNFGYRSVLRDIESQVIVATNSLLLQNLLHSEQENLYERSSLVGSATFTKKQRHVPFWVRLILPIIKKFF